MYFCCQLFVHGWLCQFTFRERRGRGGREGGNLKGKGKEKGKEKQTLIGEIKEKGIGM